MNGRIQKTMMELRAAGRKALIPYMTPEYPMRGSTPALLRALEEGGADLIEVGVPFSDPLADGPIIQQSSMIAINNGVTIRGILKDVADFRTKSEIPVILMGYTNPIVRYGIERFFSDCSAAGIDGLIVPDLPPEESGEIRTAASGKGLDLIYLIAPTSTPARIRELDGLTSGYSYCVSITGVTGSRHDLESDAGFRTFMDSVRHNTIKPFVVGFSIRTSRDVEFIWRYADGAVVGSALIGALKDCPTIEACGRRAKEFVKSLFPEPTLRKEGFQT